MLQPGVYPASVTPFKADGSMDMPGVARMLAYFEAAGCQGAVLAGTNGEGPSLSAVEKRDLIREAMPLRGRLNLILGVATPSLDEAHWLCSQAGKAGAEAILLMPPFYFRGIELEPMLRWFESVADKSPLPILAYNFPKASGFTITPEFVERLSQHSNVLGFKDSSGEQGNIRSFRDAAPGKMLLLGDETLLMDALEAGWNGTISGAANSVPDWICEVFRRYAAGEREAAAVKFELVVPVIRRLRQGPQPALHKAILHRLGVIDCADPRLPLSTVDPADTLDLMRERLGVAATVS